jgi:hypothetical protein
MNEILIGRLLRANSRGCVAGCQISQLLPAFGSMVSIRLSKTEKVYGLITNIHIDDDGLVRQLAAGGDIPEEIIQDNRLNRNVPVELSVLFIGYADNGRILHLLPPRPPLSLDRMIACPDDEICTFTSTGRFAYLRHVLSVEEITPADLAAAHFRQVDAAQRSAGKPDWIQAAMQAAIQLLRDDYAGLTAMLTACAGIYDTDPLESQEN